MTFKLLDCPFTLTYKNQYNHIIIKYTLCDYRGQNVGVLMIIHYVKNRFTFTSHTVALSAAVFLPDCLHPKQQESLFCCSPPKIRLQSLNSCQPFDDWDTRTLWKLFNSTDSNLVEKKKEGKKGAFLCCFKLSASRECADVLQTDHHL